MKKILLLCVISLLAACGTTATSSAMIDPSVNAAPICQANYGLPGCYAGNGGGE